MSERIRELSETVLRQHGWLSRQAHSLADEVLSRGTAQRWSGGSTVLRADGRVDGIYGVVDGLVAVTAAPVGLQPAIVYHAGAGSWVGVLPYFGLPRRMALRTVGETVLFHLPHGAMEALAHGDPRLARAFGELAAEQAALCIQVIEDLLQPDTGRRVAATLLRVTRDGEARVPLTQLDLATMANASRRQVNTILQSFASRGWIAQGYGSVAVLDAEGMRRSLAEKAPGGGSVPVAVGRGHYAPRASAL
jgi:CRP-like cAMP-binding protein